VAPDLVVVDGIIGMEGNGPGDGVPVRLGLLLGATSAALCDVIVAQLVGLELERIGVDTQPPDCIGCLHYWWVCPV
jgi:uncharacterized protein (DUF362 family)